MVIIPLCVGILGTIITCGGEYMGNAWSTFKTWWSRGISRYAAKIDYEGRVQYNSYYTQINLDEGMVAFFYYIFRHLDDIKGLRHLRRIPHGESTDLSDTGKTELFEEFFLAQSTSIRLPNDLSIHPLINENCKDDSDTNDKKAARTLFYSITVACDKHRDTDLNMKYLLAEYHKIHEDYLEHKRQQMNNGKQYVYMYGSKTSDQVQFHRYPITGEPKQMKHIWFPAKEGLLQEIEHFTENPEFYLRKGKPYRKVILAHGEPGCGKTSLLIALTNLLKCKLGEHPRQLIHLKLDRLTRKDLMDILFREELHVEGTFEGKVTIPFDRRIYYIEEMDTYDMTHQRKGGNGGANGANRANETVGTNGANCSGDTHSEGSDTSSLRSFDIVGDSKTPSSDTNSLEEEAKKDLLKKMFGPAPSPLTDSLKIGDLLEALDGIPSMKNGELVFMTTNHLDRIDKALTRKGRVNYLIEFKPATREDTAKQLEFYFEESMTDELRTQLPECKHTPAHIESVCDGVNTLEAAVQQLLLD
jgi:hypothetical protein